MARATQGLTQEGAHQIQVEGKADSEGNQGA